MELEPDNEPSPIRSSVSSAFGRRGPASAAEALAWCIAAWRMLRANGELIGCSGMADNLWAALLGGIVICTEYSGMGGPEDALHQITRTGEQLYKHSSGVIACLRAGDLLPHCRFTLCHHVGRLAPRCVFGDIMLRCSAEDRMRLSRLAMACKHKLWSCLAAGMKRQQAIARWGKHFFEKASIFMFAPERLQALRRMTCTCHKHGRKCFVLPSKPIGFEGLKGIIAGVNCYDWSAMGDLNGWLGASAIIFLQFLSEVLACVDDIDFLLLECTIGFEEKVGLAPLFAFFELVVLRISPTHLGFPANRPRKYMLLTKRTKLRWRRGIVEVGHQVAFMTLFARDVVMRGEALARAPASYIACYIERLAEKRGFPKTRAHGRPWTCKRVLAPGVRHTVLSLLRLARGRMEAPIL